MLELPKQILIREVDLINIYKNKEQKYHSTARLCMYMHFYLTNIVAQKLMPILPLSFAIPLP